jgi:hypothetical protein
VKRSSPGSSNKKPTEEAQVCPHPTAELKDLKSYTHKGQAMYVCPVCVTKSGAKLLVVREREQCEQQSAETGTLQRFDSLLT